MTLVARLLEITLSDGAHAAYARCTLRTVACPIQRPDETCHKSAYLSADLPHLSLDVDRFPSTLSSFSLGLLLLLILIPQLADIVVVY